MRRKGKCIDCRYCKKEAYLCIIPPEESKDCAGVYALSLDDLLEEDYCDYFEKIEVIKNE